jgi:hypothetical protein
MQIRLSAKHLVTLKPLTTNCPTKQTNLSMTNKLNLLAVEKYSKSFAAKICDDFYANNALIDGKQLLHLTNFQQINLLTIRALYEKWQAENQRLRSPYFDYGNAEIQAALKQFMNTLSQFISIKRDALEPLLVKATQETLWLMLQPHKFFSESFRDMPNFRLTLEEIGRLSRYVQINKNLIPPLTEKLGGEDFVFANQAIEWLDEILRKTPLEETEQYLAVLSETIPIPTEIYVKRRSEVSDYQQVSSFKNDSFFDSLLSDEDQLPREKPVFEPIVVRSIARPKLEFKEQNGFAKMLREEPKIEFSEQMIAQPKEEVIVEIPKTIAKETEDIRLNDHLNNDQKTLNDQVVNGTSILDSHKNRKIEDINQAISLNQRFLFINNLFNGNSEAFTAAIQELSVCQNFPSAKEILLKKYVPKYFWDITSAEAEEFFDIVRRRFN